MSEGAKININDPKVNEDSIKEALNDLEDSLKNFKFFSDFYECIADTDGIIILTEWEEYKKIDWEKVSKKMRKPSWIFDTRGVIKNQDPEKFGLNVWKLGNG